MPRMDNSHELMEFAFSYKFNWDDPGATDPIDLCEFCAEKWEKRGVDSEVEHPPYDEQWPAYVCRECGEILCGVDD